MSHSEYIQENPFRLCGVASDTLLPDLRRMANAIEMQSKVGIVPPVPFSDVFGHSEVSRCSDIVAQVSTDSRLRTVFRIFWPLSLPVEPSSLVAFSDLETAPQFRRGPFLEDQLRFLSNWYGFVGGGQTDHLDRALQAFFSLFQNPELDRVLADLLERERERGASGIVSDAKAAVRKSVLRTLTDAAVENWAGGTPESAAMIIRSVRQAEFSADELAVFCHRLVAFGDDQVSEFIAEFNRLADEFDGPDAHSFQSLEMLMRLVQRYGGMILPVTDSLDGSAVKRHDWQETFETAFASVVGLTRRFAAECIAEHNDAKSACSALEFLLNIDEVETWHSEIRKELAIASALSGRNVRRIEGAVSVERPPRYFALWGCGTRLLGRKKHSTVAGWFTKELWLCLFYFPVWPIREYTVSFAPDGRAVFHEQRGIAKRGVLPIRYALPTVGGWLGLIASVCLLYGVGVRIDLSTLPKWEVPVTPPETGNQSQQGSSTIDRILAENGKEARHIESEARVQRLTSEENELDSELATLKAQIDSERTEIDSERDEVEAAIRRLRSLRDTVDQYDSTSVDNYNEELHRLKRAESDFQSRLDAFNENVDSYNRKLARHKEVSEALKFAGWR